VANKKIEEVEGIGPAFGEKLRGCGCNDTDALLERGCTKKGRQELAKATGISEKQILRWVNMVDLFRIDGVGGEFAELLEAAGVDTVPELAQRNAANLGEKCAEVNAEKKLTRRVPTASQLEGWIAQAKQLGRKVEH
jgi:predicted flap endonuclease-1-like 5' DNA nuclease